MPRPRDKRRGPRVLLVGWDAADWKVIQPLLDAGAMPFLESLVENGVMGSLSTISPDLSPMLWTSIATGKRPFKHGILGFSEPAPDGGGVRPITNLSRKTKALWNIMTQTGRRSIVVGWWPSHPAEPIDGVMVSNRYQHAEAPFGQPWPMAPGVVHPERLVGNLARLRVHPQALDPGLIGLFVPGFSEIDQEKDHRVESVARIIADNLTVRNAAVACMHHEPWDLAAVYFDGIDHFSHGFMRYHPPRPEWVDEEDFERYREVVASGYRLHDLLLGGLLEEAGEDAYVFLVSDHGFHSDHLRPRSFPMEPAGPAAQHRPYGVFVMKGPGLKKDALIHGASLLDVCPTVLTAMGLPVGEDMDGTPLVNAFESPPAIRSLPSWDAVSGRDGRHPPDRRVDAREAREALDRLVALGYIDAPPENAAEAASQASRELHFNLARSYMDAQRHADAVPLLEDLCERYPGDYRFGIQLISCYQAVGDTDKIRPLIEELFRRKKKDAAEARKEIRALRKKNRRGDGDDPEAVKRRAMNIRRLRARASLPLYRLEYVMGSLLLAEGDAEGAMVHLNKAMKSETDRPELHLKIGEAWLAIRDYSAALESFSRAAKLDPDSAPAHQGRARSLLALKKNHRAAEAALQTVGLAYHNPMAHYVLGAALHRLGRLSRAVEALSVAVAQNPNFVDAYRRLAYIHKHRLNAPGWAAEYRRRAREASKRLRALKKGEVLPAEADRLTRQAGTSEPGIIEAYEISPAPAPVKSADTIVIVSGLPRSGTSMMLQMLAAGGLPVLTDNVREADEDNPAGYLEYEPVKRLANSSAWLRDAGGRAVKIVAPLLGHLPPPPKGASYRVIYMERPLAEVLGSQRKMLERISGSDGETDEAGLRRAFTHQSDRARGLLAARRIPALVVDYRWCINEPEKAAARVNRFLGQGLDESAMARTVNPDLYRNRSEPTTG